MVACLQGEFDEENMGLSVDVASAFLGMQSLASETHTNDRSDWMSAVFWGNFDYFGTTSIYVSYGFI